MLLNPPAVEITPVTVMLSLQELPARLGEDLRLTPPIEVESTMQENKGVGVNAFSISESESELFQEKSCLALLENISQSSGDEFNFLYEADNLELDRTYNDDIAYLMKLLTNSVTNIPQLIDILANTRDRSVASESQFLAVLENIGTENIK